MTPPPDQPPPPGTDTTGKQPYPSGVLARIVAINFPSAVGLPIRIFPSSGLFRGSLDLSQTAISIWFRVSSEAIAAARADYASRTNAIGAGSFDLDAIFIGTIPILSWGEKTSFEQYGTSASGAELDHSFFGNPNFLGVQVDPTQSYLSLRLNAPPDNLGGFISASESPTGYASNWPEYFLIGPAPPTVNWIQYNPGSSYIGQISVAPDVWHHLLVSYDVSGGTVGSCWIALDGRDYPMNNYGWPSGVGPTLDSGSSYSGLGPNEIVAGFQMFADDPDVAMTPGFSLDPGPYIGLTSPNNELSLHTSTVDVAELYIWSGMTLTSEDASLFISSTGTPAPPASLPFPLPDIRIHGSQAWIKGNNSGHLIGDFTPFGELLIIKPDPQIGT